MIACFAYSIFIISFVVLLSSLYLNPLFLLCPILLPIPLEREVRGCVILVTGEHLHGPNSDLRG